MSWFSRMLSERDGWPSSKRFGYVFVLGVMSGIAMCLTKSIYPDKQLAASTLLQIIPWLCSMAGVAYVGGKVADNLIKPKGDNDAKSEDNSN